MIVVTDEQLEKLARIIDGRRSGNGGKVLEVYKQLVQLVFVPLVLAALGFIFTNQLANGDRLTAVEQKLEGKIELFDSKLDSIARGVEDNKYNYREILKQLEAGRK